MNTNTLTLYHTYLARTTALLAVVCAVSVLLYGIFLLMAVAHTAARTAAQHQVKGLTAQLGEIEMAYLTQQKDITPEHAQTLGFVAPTAVSVVYTSSLRQTLTINTNRGPKALATCSFHASEC